MTDNRWVVIPKGKSAERQTNSVSADAGMLHMAEFLGALRTRGRPGCPVEEGLRSTAAVKLAMIAYETGTTLAWDEASEQIAGNNQASGLLKRPYRAPWPHPYHT